MDNYLQTIFLFLTQHTTFRKFINYISGGVVRVTYSSPRINMDAKKLDLTVQIDAQENVEGYLKLKLSREIEDIFKIRCYWGVDIKAFHHVLRSPWPWFEKAFQNGNLFGSEGCQILDPILQIENQIELDLKIHPNLNLGQTPRTKYPLVLVVNCVNYFIIYVIHIQDKSFMPSPSHILGQYIKLNDSRVTHLVPIYNNDCVVCISKPATRVNLPCRHASTCGQCFSRLPQGKCPMCRSQIDSYFLIGEEDTEEINEEEISPPLTWRQRLAEMEHRFAMAVGLQEHD